MREMILNHASVFAGNRDTAVEWLNGLVHGLKDVVADGVAEPSLRACYHPQEISCLPGCSLFDLFEELRERGFREEFIFLIGLNTKSPILKDTDGEIANRFLQCEHATLPKRDGEPLVYCAITNGISVGFPSEPSWENDQITVTFDELSLEGDITPAVEQVDNLTRSTHASPIVRRHRVSYRNNLLQSADGRMVWDKKSEAFPHLMFSPSVEANLTILNRGLLATVINKLSAIDDSAAMWPQHEGYTPPWGSKVTDENTRVKNNPDSLNARRFLSHDGTLKLFLWHARFGSAGRIHLYFDRRDYSVEIGYIGHHLP